MFLIYELPTFYWLQKLHKSPYKSCLISNSSQCSTTIHSKYIAFAFNHTARVAVATTTDHPKSSHNRCLIEVFGGVLCCRFELKKYVGIETFVKGLSQISYFFSVISS